MFAQIVPGDKILFQRGRQYSIFIPALPSRPGTFVKASKPLWTRGGSKMAEVHGKLDVIKFLLITTEVIIEVSHWLERHPFPGEPVWDERFHEISLNKAPPRCLHCRWVASSDSPVPWHAWTCWSGVRPPLRRQEAPCHPPLLLPVSVVVVRVVVVLQLAISASAADPLAPDTVVAFSVAHWSRWSQRESRSRGAASGNLQLVNSAASS